LPLFIKLMNCSEAPDGLAVEELRLQLPLKKVSRQKQIRKTNRLGIGKTLTIRPPIGDEE